MLTDQQIRSLETKRIFFGHQSVGDDIVQGIRELIGSDPRLKLTVVSSADPQLTTEASFIEARIGVNRDPESKNRSFVKVLDKGFGAQGGIAFFKYCYVDFGSNTDVQKIFDRYRKEVTHIKHKYPSLKIVHVTVPLTTDDSGRTTKERIKTILRHLSGRDPNVKRNQFNRLLRETYEGHDPMFDIADVEATRPDGSKSYFMRGIEKVYTMVPEFTTDGGHLNEAGRRLAAQRLLPVLANL